MAFDSPSRRYERYAARCKLLGMEPATFNTWRGVLAGIPELKIIALRYERKTA
jgi:hypothetical protein